MNNYQSLPEILTALDIARYLNICYNSALKLIRYHIPYIKLGSSYRVTRANFIRFLERDTSIDIALSK